MATELLHTNYYPNITPFGSTTNQNIEGLELQATPYNIKTFLNNDSVIQLNLLSIPENQLINQELNYKNYIIETYELTPSNQEKIGEIGIDFVKDFDNLFNEGINSARYSLVYYIYDNVIGSNLQQLYISEISSDRTEIKLDSFSLTDIDIVEQTDNFIQQREESDHFVDFYLNHGNNVFSQAINVKVINQDIGEPSILIKLIQPLDQTIQLNSSLWLIKFLIDPIVQGIAITTEPEEYDDSTPIKGPNFNIDVKDFVNNSTILKSYNDLLQVNSSSSLNQLESLLDKKEININVDYTNFSNYIHFSSAQTRLENFVYKVNLIESYSNNLLVLNNTSTSNNISSSKAIYEGKITNIVNNFDGYERYLYYKSGSLSYPKSNSQIPYSLYSVTSSIVSTWLGSSNQDSPSFGGIYASSSEYDISNRNQLLKSIPEYLRDDPSNQQYELFVDMVAQHYDNIWIYLKDITNKYDNDNRLNFGISKDLVADAIRDFGIKLYQNSFSNDDLYTAFLGLTPEGGLFPYPNMTGSLPTPQGFEYVDVLISASNDILPQEEVNKSLYKRIYHNLPYLINSKGTLPGLKALITSYGIPDTILRINEYGGKDKVNVNDWDHWQNEFNYAFNTTEDNFISSSWSLHPSWSAVANVPETLMFRFKTNGLPKTGSYHYSQSLWYGDGNDGAAITLTYTGSGYTSASHAGSIKDPYYQYATLNFYPNVTSPAITASIYLPFFDGEWWSVMLNWSGGSEWELFSGNKLYEGGDNDTRIGFFESSSITGDKTPWLNTDKSYFPVSFSVSALGGYDVTTYNDTGIYDGTTGVTSSYIPFSGSYQEIRYYASIISESVFKDYVMNPYSTEGNSTNSSPNELAFRASVGGELYTLTQSIHPKVTGSWATTHSFATNNSDFYFDSTPYFIKNKEYFFIDQPVAGIKNVIGDKIRIEDNIYPTGSVLSPYKSLLQQTNVSQSYTSNINYLEVAFSPQNQINDDIMSQIGFFNIGDYIGDPRLRSSSADSYPALDKLRDEYFQKYIKNYDLKDFIRLIKFFDNSLFKMIKTLYLRVQVLLLV